MPVPLNPPDWIVSSCGGGTTRTSTRPMRPATSAVICVAPGAMAVTTPAALTVATPGRLLDQFGERPVTTRWAPSSIRALSTMVRATSSRSGCPGATTLTGGAVSCTSLMSLSVMDRATVVTVPGRNDSGPTIWRSTATPSRTRSTWRRTMHSSAAGAATTPLVPVTPARDASARQLPRSTLTGTSCLGTSAIVSVCVPRSIVVPPCRRYPVCTLSCTNAA